MPLVKIKRYEGSSRIFLTTDTSSVPVGGGITNLNRTLILTSLRSAYNYFYEANFVTSQLRDSSGTIYADFARASTGVYSNVDISFLAIELDANCTVQHKTKVIAKNTSTATDTITDLSTLARDGRYKSFIIHSVKSNETAAAIPVSNLAVTAEITGNTQVTFKRNVSSDAAITVEYQVVTMPDIRYVQTKTGTKTQNPQDVTISRAEVERSLCFYSFKMNNPTGSVSIQALDMPYAFLTTNTNLRIQSYSQSLTTDYCVQVVHFEFGKVYNNITNVLANNLNATGSIGATIDISKTMTIIPTHMNTMGGANSTSENAGHYLWSLNNITPTGFTVDRGDSGGAPAASVRTSTIQFDCGTGGNKNLYFRKERGF